MQPSIPAPEASSDETLPRSSFIADVLPCRAAFRRPLHGAEQAMKASSHKLPKGAVTVVAEGGNHRGFASYSWQPLDWEVRSRARRSTRFPRPGVGYA